ncbi:uncharacterized protein BYT42DRAFT_141204 [Radiomyces spectabilis]|uniref:uncharacterized protein n=1 Tax=Radiomyces spectabilis TaxID=64574 RepID=UPI002220BDD5|nr:uncharacterized protein BYT42DRAFT_141204 [Radiomyces spectabilis]KAI8366730.1 hypothetical protein BYT42DRAFT_141204 [Radiomyces spectabilis]
MRIISSFSFLIQIHTRILCLCFDLRVSSLHGYIFLPSRRIFIGRGNTWSLAANIQYAFFTCPLDTGLQRLS